jgi:hypothetical protein
MAKNIKKGKTEISLKTRTKKWVTLTYCGKKVQYITKLFKGANVRIKN